MSGAARESPEDRRRRLGRRLLLLGWLLVTAGGCVLIFLRTLPLPVRVLTGLTDLIAGAVLLATWNQRFRRSPP